MTGMFVPTSSRCTTSEAVRYREAETDQLSLPLAAPLPPKYMVQPLKNCT
jgi:hypothetical protein